MADKKIDFTEFQKTDFDSWKNKVIADLKGKDYNILQFPTDEEIEIQAIIEPKIIDRNDPDIAPYTRGDKQDNNDWIIFKSYEDTVTNADLLHDLNKGISGIDLTFDSYHHIDQLLENVELEYIYSSFSVKTPDQACQLLEKLPGSANGWVNFNPIAKDSLVGIDEVLKYTIPRPTFKAFNIDGADIRNRGGNIIDEVAYLLSCGNEYLNHFRFTGIHTDLVTENILFTTGIGPNYFFEIAKIRAIRMLWANIVDQYHPESSKAFKIHLHAKTMSLNLHDEDPYNNLLRQTTEAMSAAIGGVDSMEVVPYQGKSADEKELFQRMAKNIQLILKEESLINQVIDPAGGSYYIELLTEEIAKRSWKKFQEMEAQGGYMEIYDDFMQGLVGKRTDYLSSIESGKRVQIGVNKYQMVKA
ncbi:MAG: methylmalonyl-CoA mutase family protein [Crocinitomicaceae bacterium]